MSLKKQLYQSVLPDKIYVEYATLNRVLKKGFLLIQNVNWLPGCFIDEGFNAD